MAVNIVVAATIKRALGQKQSTLGRWLGTAGVAIVALAMAAVLMLVAILGAVIANHEEGGSDSCFTDEEGVPTSTVADIPAVAFEAYKKSGTATGISWSVIAAIGFVESGHGTNGGNHLDKNGDTKPGKIQGPMTRFNARAQGPMQFMPATWGAHGMDGNHDGKKDPHNIHDAALAAGFYLKHRGAPKDMRAGIRGYNASDAYVDSVLEKASEYAKAAETSSDDTDAAPEPTKKGKKKNPAGTAGRGTSKQAAGGRPGVVLTRADIMHSIATAKDVPQSKGKKDWVLPIPAGKFVYTNKFGVKKSYYASGSHTGLDYAAPGGTPVASVAEGIASVSSVAWAGPHYVTVDHGTVNGKSVQSTYGHMRAHTITNGQRVAMGQQIGEVGTEGNSTADHLHLEIRVDGRAIDPMLWLAAAGTPDLSGGVPGGEECGPTGASGVVGADGSWGGYQNGHIPADALCAPDFTTVLLECTAAAALSELNKAYEAKFGQNVGPVGGYRDHAGQLGCSASKGSLCAKPGTSIHGWGLAADLAGGGINVSYDTPQHKWMRKNAPDYGWVLPRWAMGPQNGGSKVEPWHWEFIGNGMKVRL